MVSTANGSNPSSLIKKVNVDKYVEKWHTGSFAIIAKLLYFFVFLDVNKLYKCVFKKDKVI